ncbi:right-handed parallel beta-helix repeat-containing protein [Streptomyces sp. H27-D2]|uniref:right-handed parallel beta-helix repeat-containing protein n=1 Tax=Streptomyces sp. H27-D2 TaxID=3046304 RepID=UPI002DBA69A5|nr:right-handed parallel beta-helix repeat-containing protein [Streptomyces sp. H27-D2]MEC4016106.1 right-handed parallel beta-helix repeat-containing protein [Streptomyces sp. H27-D2]
MSRHAFGLSTADIAMERVGDQLYIRPGATGTAWDSLVGGSPYGDLTDLESNPTSTVTADANGSVGFYGPDNISVVYIDFGYSTRYLMAATDLGSQIDTLTAGKVDRAGDTIDGDLTVAGGVTVNGTLAATADATVAGNLTVAGVLSAEFNLSSMGIYSVTSYGATGNGVTDDAPSIQGALDAVRDANGGQVLVPPGTYRLATLPLRIYKKTRLTLMPGATMRRDADVTVLTNGDAAQVFGGYTGHGDLIIEGGLWDMRGTAVGLTASRMCMSLGHGYNILVRDTEIRDVPGYHAIEVNSSKDVRVIGCRFRGYVDPGGRDFSEAIQPDLAKGSSYFGAFGPYDHTPCEDLLISGCYFGPSGTVGTVAWPRGIGSHSATITKWHRRVRVIGCSFEGMTQYAMTAYNYEDVTFEANTISGCAAGFRAQPPVTSDPNDTKLPDGTQTSASQAVKNFAITGNTFRNIGSHDEAIILDGVTTGKVMNVTISGNTIDGVTAPENGMRLIHAQQVTVNGNVIRTAGNTGISQDNVDGVVITGNRIYAPTGSGISCDTGTGVLISDNVVQNAGVNGIHVLGGSDVQVLDNTVRGASRAAAGSYGIRVSSGADKVTVVGNSIRKFGSGNEAAYGLSITSTCTDVRRWGNDLADSGTSGPLDDQSTGADTSPFDDRGSIEDAMRPAGRYETTSRLRCGATSAAMVSGTLYLVPIWLPKGAVVSNISFMNGATAAGTPTNWWFTLHNSSRVALARTADQTTVAWAANTVKTLAVAQTTAGTASSYTTTYTGLHYLGVMIKATTLPNLVGEGSMSTGPGAAPGFGDTSTGQSTPPTVTAGAFTAGAFGGSVGLLAYGYTA